MLHRISPWTVVLRHHSPRWRLDDWEESQPSLVNTPWGTDAPICQDTPSGGLDDLLTSAEVGHDALVNLSRKRFRQRMMSRLVRPAAMRRAT